MRRTVGIRSVSLYHRNHALADTQHASCSNPTESGPVFPDPVPALISHRFHRGVGWCLVAVVVVLSLIPTPTVPPVTGTFDDKIAHCLVYATIMGWFAVITPRPSWWRLAGAVIALGVALELCQGALPYRTASFADVLANTLGVLLGAGGACLVVARAPATVATDHPE